MTHKTTMPEPFTFFHGYRTQDLNGNKDDKPPMPYVGLPLFTTDQAEAYKDACVRGALEEAAMICWEMQSKPEYGKDDKDRWLAIAEQRIRALIPKEPPCDTF